MGLAQILLYLLLLVRDLSLSVFLNCFVLHAHRVLHDHKQTKRGLPNTGTSYFQLLDRQVPSLLRRRRLLYSKYFKGKERQTVKVRFQRFFLTIRCKYSCDDIKIIQRFGFGNHTQSSSKIKSIRSESTIVGILSHSNMVIDVGID